MCCGNVKVPAWANSCATTPDVARSLGARTVWLGVWEHNSRAIAFYRRNGFEEFGEHLFMPGSDEQRDVLMRKKVGE